MRIAIGNTSVSRLGTARRWLASVSILSLTTVSAGIFLAPSASAANIPGVISEVVATQSDGSQGNTVYNNGGLFRFYFSWAIPDGQKAGDTFSIHLPPQLNADPLVSFPIRMPGAPFDTVANCGWSSKVATCTLTSYVETNSNLNGIGFFRASLTDIRTGTQNYVVNGSSVPESLTLEVVAPSGPFATQPASVSGNWTDPSTQGSPPAPLNDVIQWSLGPPVAASVQRASTITATLPSPMVLTCPVTVANFSYQHTFNDADDTTPMPVGLVSDLACDGNTVQFTLPNGLAPFEFVALSIYASLPGPPTSGQLFSTSFTSTDTAYGYGGVTGYLQETAGGQGSIDVGTTVNLIKNVTNAHPGIPTTFSTSVSCVDPALPENPPIVNTPQVPSDSSITTVRNLVIGSVCTVTETNPPAEATVSYSGGTGPDSNQVTLVTGVQATITITNTFVPVPVLVPVNVMKSVVGLPPSPAPAGYGVTLVCTPPGGVPVTTLLTLPADGTLVPTEGVVVGSSCTVEETDPPVGATVSYEPGGTFVVGSQGIDVTVTNTFVPDPVTAVSLQAVVQGFPPAPVPTSYVVAVTCTPRGGGPAVPYPVTLPADGTPVVQRVANGSICVVAELSPPPEVIVSYSPAMFVAEGTPVDVAITNYYAPRQMFVRNVVVGTVPSPAPTNYLLSIICAGPSGGPTTTETVSLLSNAAALTTRFYSFGSVCALQELNPPMGAVVDYKPNQTFIFAPETRVRVYNTFTDQPR